MKKIAAATLGCKVNQVETASLIEAFQAKGYEIVPFKDQADVYLVNTCAVTAKAAYESRQLLRRALKKNPLLVVATGCYAQIAPEEIKEKVEAPILIVGQAYKARIPEIIESLSLPLEETRIVLSEVRELKVCEPFPLSRFPEHKRAFLRVQDGCSLFCTYCVVPHARGPSRSLPLATIKAQVERFLAAGHLEIVVTGIHLGSWGKDLTPPRDLLALVALLEELKVYRYRLSSLAPNEIKRELLDFLERAPGFCPHFHLSLQSASDEVLRKMGRRYRQKDFLRVVEDIKKRFAEAAIGVDVIAGFPAEREEDSEATYRLLEELPLAYFHVFPFSPRPGTRAARWPQLPPHVVAERARRLQTLAQAKKKAFYAGQIGKTLELLVLRRDPARGLLEGLSRNYVTVFFQGEDELVGQVVSAKVERMVDTTLYGILETDRITNKAR